MSKQIDVNDKTEVVKSDTIVRARYKLNPLSLKFITVLIAGIKRGDDLNQVYEFRVSEFKELVGLKRKDLYWSVKSSVKEILEKPLYIPRSDDDNSFLMINWVSSAEYKEGKGVVEFEISKKLRPYLLSLKERFLKYRLENILSLSNSYSIRLYEILKDWLEVNKRYNKKTEKMISVKDLKEILEIPKGYKYADIKRRILNKAKDELYKRTDIKFSYEEVRTGRQVTHVKFIIFDNIGSISKIEDGNKQAITVDKVVVKIPDELLSKLKQSTPEILEAITKYMDEKGFEYVLSNIEYANKNAKDNYVAYLINALKNDWAKNARQQQEEYNELSKAEEEYKKFIGLRFNHRGMNYIVQDSSVYCEDTRSAIALSDIFKNWGVWHKFLKGKANGQIKT